MARNNSGFDDDDFAFDAGDDLDSGDDVDAEDELDGEIESEIDGIDAEDLAELDKLDGIAEPELSDGPAADAEEVPASIDFPIYQLFLAYSRESFFAAHKGPPLAAGSKVVVPTRYGRDMAVVSRVLPSCPGRRYARVAWITRPATQADLDRAANNERQEDGAFNLCRERIEMHGLDMRLVSVHFVLDEPKVIFLFTSESRVDFRELVKDLMGIFRLRVELRQIGSRDQARILGGLGICGRCFCCCRGTSFLKPVSIKMAKDQDLSLSMLKISGPCGRLLCCLGFEQCFYGERRRTVPRQGAKILYDGVSWHVREANLVTGLVTMTSEDDRQMKVAATRFAKVDGRWSITPA